MQALHRKLDVVLVQILPYNCSEADYSFSVAPADSSNCNDLECRWRSFARNLFWLVAATANWLASRPLSSQLQTNRGQWHDTPLHTFSALHL